MKCLQNPVNGEVRRVPENRVSDLRKKGWVFVNKQTWKQSTDTTWQKASTPANPMSLNKQRRKETRNGQ